MSPQQQLRKVDQDAFLKMYLGQKTNFKMSSHTHFLEDSPDQNYGEIVQEC